MGLVLIVDDDERNAKLVRDVLERSGLQVVCAGTAAEGLAAARVHRPGVVLMDLNLPDLDGAETTRRLLADDRTAGTAVILVSAVAVDDPAWVEAAGFAGFVQKPIDVRSLPELVRRHLRAGG